MYVSIIFLLYNAYFIENIILVTQNNYLSGDIYVKTCIIDRIKNKHNKKQCKLLFSVTLKINFKNCSQQSSRTDLFHKLFKYENDKAGGLYN